MTDTDKQEVTIFRDSKGRFKKFIYTKTPKMLVKERVKEAEKRERKALAEKKREERKIQKRASAKPERVRISKQTNSSRSIYAGKPEYCTEYKECQKALNRSTTETERKYWYGRMGEIEQAFKDTRNQDKDSMVADLIDWGVADEYKSNSWKHSKDKIRLMWYRYKNKRK